MGRLAIAMGALLIASAVPAQEPPPASHEATPEERPSNPPGATPTAPSEPPPSAAPPGEQPATAAPPPAAHNKMIPVGPAPAPRSEEPSATLPPIECDHQELAGTVVGYDQTRLWVKENGKITLLKLEATTSIDGGHSLPGQEPSTHGLKRGDPVRACYLARPQDGGPELNVAVAVDGPRSYEP